MVPFYSRRVPHLLIAFLFGISTVAGVASAVTVPSGFSQSQIGGSLDSPTAFAIAPDGRIFVCEQEGRLRVIKDGELLATPFLSVTVSSVGERGLLGVAFDPAFASNHFVYVYYTAVTPSIHNRLSRFTANGDVAVSGSERILLEIDDLTSATNHNGGAIRFGADGKLYVGVGENATSSNAQTTSNLLGKLLRLNNDGTIPTDNPFSSSASGKNRAIWAVGLRNPFTFAVQPGTGRIFINDVGQDTFEEVDEGREGANYGWPATEGPTSNSAYDSPIYSYAHGGSSDCAITGAAFYNPATPQFPSSYTGDFFFADYCGGWIKRLDAAGSYATASGFATGIASPVDLAVSGDGALYYLARGSGTNAGGVYRIEYTLNKAPSITVQPADVSVTVGAPAAFSVSASGTPPLSYQWQRNGANISGATSSSYTIASAQLADDAAAFRCRVTNAYGNVTSNSATLSVTANLAPVAAITSPGNGATYAGGQTISYSGTGTDPEDGTLPASAFEWEVVFHHDTHTHPFIAPTTGSKSGSFVIPTTGETSDNVWYRIHLTVKDSDALTHSVFRDVVPRKTNLTFATLPPGLQILLDGQPLSTPATVVGVEGIVRTLGVTSPQNKGGVDYTFVSWSDGGAATHSISTPTSDTTYTASFASPTPNPTPTPTRTPVPPTPTPTPPPVSRTPTPTPPPPVATPTPTPTPSTTPPPAASAPPNGSLEEGVDSPTGWTLDMSEDNGSWEWDDTTASDGVHSARLTVPGSEERKSPYLRSASFVLQPATDYDFSAWTKSAGIDGFYGAFVWVVELDAEGNVLKNPLGWSRQHAIKASQGSSDWTKGMMTFRTDPRCAAGFIYANIYRAHGTVWVDDFRVEESAAPPAASASSR
jgi:glucose/arabinose dehydrogenase